MLTIIAREYIYIYLLGRETMSLLNTLECTSMFKFANKCHQSCIFVNFEDHKFAVRDNKYIWLNQPSCNYLPITSIDI